MARRGRAIDAHARARLTGSCPRSPAWASMWTKRRPSAIRTGPRLCTRRTRARPMVRCWTGRNTSALQPIHTAMSAPASAPEPTIESLAAIEPTPFPFLTAYVDLRPGDSHEGVPAFFKTALRRKGKRFDDGSDEKVSFDRDAERLLELFETGGRFRAPDGRLRSDLPVRRRRRIPADSRIRRPAGEAFVARWLSAQSVQLGLGGRALRPLRRAGDRRPDGAHLRLWTGREDRRGGARGPLARKDEGRRMVRKPAINAVGATSTRSTSRRRSNNWARRSRRPGRTASC